MPIDGKNAYKQARDTAWKVLLENHVKSLPVDVFDLCEKNGIVVSDSKNASGFLSALGFDIRAVKMNTVLFCPADRIVVVYDERFDERESRMQAAIALGNLLLGHLPSDASERKIVPVFSSEQTEQAYQFAVRLLMPLCVLRAIGVESSTDIANLCCVPSTEAARRLLRLRSIELRNQKFGDRTGQGVFNLSHYERRLRNAFSAYIDAYNRNKKRSK